MEGNASSGPIVNRLVPSVCLIALLAWAGCEGASDQTAANESDPPTDTMTRSAPQKTPRCGNHVCSANESCSTCPADCGTCPAACGDGTCNGTETCSTCAGDCGTCPAACGDGTCNGSETCSTCAADCGTCPAACGDGTCNGTETCSTCAADCGACTTASQRIAFESDRTGTRSIYLANADGSGVVFLTTGDRPTWSGDGTKIAFDRAGSIYVVDASGANERLLRAGWDPSWSRNGTKIAYHSSGTGGGVYVMNADGTSPTLVMSDAFADPGWGDYCACSPALSPDAQTVAFVRANYEDGFEIYTKKADGTGSASLLPGDGWAQDSPTWSPDGSRVGFMTPGSSGERIASVIFPGATDFKVHVTNAYYPAWGPDGRSFLFTRNASLGAPTRIWVLRGDGSVAQLIPSASSPAKSDYSDRDPTWSFAP